MTIIYLIGVHETSSRWIRGGVSLGERFFVPRIGIRSNTGIDIGQVRPCTI